MFATSTHKKDWLFKSEDDIVHHRKQSVENFVVRQQAKGYTGIDYLTPEDDDILLKYFERKLMDFCMKFKPPMPKSVIGTTFVYYKRFYMYNTVMDYHPKEILVTAAYLACKVEEFNLSLEQFVANINGNKERAMEIILNHELLLMTEIKFSLTVHTPWRPLEGLLIDIKTRFASNDPDAVEALRQHIDKFLTDVNFTNACLIYAPSQMALAAIIHATSKQGQNLDAYVTKVLFGSEGDKLASIIEAVRNIRLMVKNVPVLPSMSVIKILCDRLETCRNQDNNPDSEAYKRKMQELLDDEDDRSYRIAGAGH